MPTLPSPLTPYYGGGQVSNPANVIQKAVAPNTADTEHNIGTIYVNTANGAIYVLTGKPGGVATWSSVGAATGGVDTINSLIPTGGNINILGTSNQVSIANAGSTVTLSIPSTFIAPGSVKSTTTLEVGTDLTVDGNAAVTGTLTMTGTTTLAALTVVGTANINATGTATTTIGSTSGANAVVMRVGTGNFSLDGAAGSTYTVGASTTTGTFALGGTAQTGTITLGSSSGTNIVAIGAGTGATTVNIAGGAGSAKAVNIATGAVANVVIIGSVSGAASVSLLCGTGNFSASGAVTSTYSIGSSTGTGAMTFGLSTAAQTINIQSAASNTGAQVVNILSGATPGANTTLNVMCGAGTAGTQTVNILATGATRAGVVAIGTGAAAHAVTVGSTNTTAATTIQAGSGGIAMTGAVTSANAVTITAGDFTATLGNMIINGAAKQLRCHGGAVTDFIGQATLVNGTVTILNTNIASTDRIFIQRSAVNASSALGVFKSVITASTNFVITACKPADATTETGDASTVDYFIVRQV